MNKWKQKITEKKKIYKSVAEGLSGIHDHKRKAKINSGQTEDLVWNTYDIIPIRLKNDTMEKIVIGEA